MEMTYMQAERTLVFMVWTESHIEVGGRIGRGDTLCHAQIKVDVMIIPLF